MPDIELTADDLTAYIAERERAHAIKIELIAGDMTPEERANGWTPQTLAAYIAERERANAIKIMHPEPRVPRRQVDYRPLRWRR